MKITPQIYLPMFSLYETSLSIEEVSMAEQTTKASESSKYSITLDSFTNTKYSQ